MHSSVVLLAFLAFLHATSAWQGGVPVQVQPPKGPVNQAGVTFGTCANNPPSPQEAVGLIKSLHAQKVRLYAPDINILQALRNTGIEVVLGVPNEEVQNIGTSQDKANQWIQNYVKNFQDINFRYIVVGNGISSLNEHNGQYAQCLIQAMQNIQNAINACGLQNKVKVSTALDHSIVLNQIHPPSNAVFNPAIKQNFIFPVLQFLKNNNAPFLINLHPYYSYAFNKPEVPLELNQGQSQSNRDIRLEYANFRSASFLVQDGQLKYQNVFDAMVDSVYVALEKAGASSLDVVVAETGWPTCGGTAADANNAGTFNNNLISHIKRTGTPKRPQNCVETYIYNLIDEDKRGKELEAHWGIFDQNKQARYPISFWSPSDQ
ncbi:glucan endo-1,3-beta-glucosidase, acidic [Daucus carota subsp. sativus]|uniref:glucan endo-1,3-beta-glucosidase, acidic n=1 Tax=Daucus carota subsp. sativus TaxID=79200 RepID=UPI0007EF2DC0|nr:PREDICTED: glucan endo-1,3-beta-glucosidase, acidic-like [Daucus carota subsp. sativus]